MRSVEEERNAVSAIKNHVRYLQRKRNLNEVVITNIYVILDPSTNIISLRCCYYFFAKCGR